MDKYDEYENECGHASCTAEKRVGLRIIDLLTDDDRLEELLTAMADAFGHPGGAEKDQNIALAKTLIGLGQALLTGELFGGDEAAAAAAGLGIEHAMPQMGFIPLKIDTPEDFDPTKPGAVEKIIGKALLREGTITEVLAEVPHGDPEQN